MGDVKNPWEAVVYGGLYMFVLEVMGGTNEDFGRGVVPTCSNPLLIFVLYASSDWVVSNRGNFPSYLATPPFQGNFQYLYLHLII